MQQLAGQMPSSPLRGVHPKQQAEKCRGHSDREKATEQPARTNLVRMRDNKRDEPTSSQVTHKILDRFFIHVTVTCLQQSQADVCAYGSAFGKESDIVCFISQWKVLLNPGLQMPLDLVPVNSILLQDQFSNLLNDTMINLLILPRLSLEGKEQFLSRNKNRSE